MAKKKASTFFINRRLEFLAQAFYVAGIFLYIPAWILGHDLETRLPSIALMFVSTAVVWGILAYPIYRLCLGWKVRPDVARTFLAAFGFILLPVMLGVLPLVNRVSHLGEPELITVEVIDIHGEPGTEESVSLVTGANALVEFEHGKRRRFPISRSEYEAITPRESYLHIARQRGLVGLVRLSNAGLATSPDADTEGAAAAEEEAP